MMQDWYRITNTKMLIIVGVSLLWVLTGCFLYAKIGVEHGPDGGLDSVAEALVYVFFWRLIIYGPPVLMTGIGFGIWLCQNHRELVIRLLAAVVFCILMAIAYRLYFRKLINTPERVARQVMTYEKWEQEKKKYGFSEDRTDSDCICEYVKEMVSDVNVRVYSIYREVDTGTKTAYIDAAMEAHIGELSGVEGWAYIPDVRDIIPARADGDDRFLLNNRELRLVAEHFDRSLRRDHWYDRYQFQSFVIAEWYSWLSMMAVFYDDGTMDIVIVP